MALACTALLLGAVPACAAPPDAMGDGGALRARCPENQVAAEESKIADAGAAKKIAPCGKAAHGQNEPLKKLPALKRPALQQSELSSRAQDLNPQPLPPQKAGPPKIVKGDARKVERD